MLQNKNDIDITHAKVYHIYVLFIFYNFVKDKGVNLCCHLLNMHNI